MQRGRLLLGTISGSFRPLLRQTADLLVRRTTSTPLHKSLFSLIYLKIARYWYQKGFKTFLGRNLKINGPVSASDFKITLPARPKLSAKVGAENFIYTSAYLYVSKTAFIESSALRLISF